VKQPEDIAKRLAELEQKARERKKKTKGATVRKPPRQENSITKAVQCYDISAKDNKSIMDVAVFRLSKKDKSAMRVIFYELPDGHIRVSSG
jgi:hypothetical protein